MLKYICLGSGSSGNCYLLNAEGVTILIDAGIGFRTLKRHLQSFGFQAKDIAGVLITHDHADHIKSVGKLAAEYDIYNTFQSLLPIVIVYNYLVK